MQHLFLWHWEISDIIITCKPFLYHFDGHRPMHLTSVSIFCTQFDVYSSLRALTTSIFTAEDWNFCSQNPDAPEHHPRFYLCIYLSAICCKRKCSDGAGAWFETNTLHLVVVNFECSHRQLTSQSEKKKHEPSVLTESSVIQPDKSYKRIIDNLSPPVLYVFLWFKYDIGVKAPPVLIDVSSGIPLYVLLMPCTIDLTRYFHSVWFSKVLPIFFCRIYEPEELRGLTADI